MIRKKLLQNSGFTLVELLTSTMIIVMISGLFMANYRSAERQYRLNGAANQLASDLRLIQSYALGAKKLNGQVPAGGWGIDFDQSANNKYVLFADDANAPRGFDILTPGTDKVIKLVNLPQDVIIRNNGMKVDSIIEAGAGIIFLPPDPQTIIYHRSIGPEGKFFEIELQDVVSGNVKKVTVNSFGLIETQ